MPVALLVRDGAYAQAEEATGIALDRINQADGLSQRTVIIVHRTNRYRGLFGKPVDEIDRGLDPIDDVTGARPASVTQPKEFCPSKVAQGQGTVSPRRGRSVQA